MRVFGQGNFDAGVARRAVRPIAEILEGRQLLATIVVNTTGDADGADGSSTLSLRQAIEISNGTLAIASLSTAQAALVSGALSTPNTIDFAIPGTGPFTISPTSSLPAITSPAIIDGDSQPGAHPNTNGPGQGDNATLLVALVGSAATSGSNGLDIKAESTTVMGLAIGGFATGISVDGKTPNDFGGDLFQGNFIGTDTTGTKPIPNGMGIFLQTGAFHTIGGTTPGARNVISGNDSQGIYIFGLGMSFGDLVVGNFIGTDVTGTKPIPNKGGGLVTNASGSNTIGGMTPGAGNVISGNGYYGGLSLLDVGDLVAGNFIGTDLTGTKPIPNSQGIGLPGNGPVTVGGTTTQARNIISGNNGQAIRINSSGNLIEGNFIGTDVTGTKPIPNGSDGIYVAADSNTIGGTTAGAGNVISDSGNDGINVSSGSDTLISGNLIGTDVTGTIALPNEGDGILVEGGFGSSSTSSTIGGTTASDRNIISGNSGYGVEIQGDLESIPFGAPDSGSKTLVEGNFIGTDVTGTKAIPNGSDGIYLAADSNTIGGTATGAGNLISGNLGNGINISGQAASAGVPVYFLASNNSIEGNFIGSDLTGSQPLPNAVDGILIIGGANDTIGGTVAGAGNVIAFNRQSGVTVNNGVTTPVLSNNVGDEISGNAIFANGGLGIDLGNDGVTPNNPAGSPTGPNLLQPYPLLTSSAPGATGTVISGTLDALPSTAYTVEFFSNPVGDPSGYGQGKTYLGSAIVNTDASGDSLFTFTTPTPPTGEYVTATARDLPGNTSEFSADLTIGSFPTSTSLLAQNEIVTLGQSTTFAAVVGGSGSIPTGEVNFLQDGVVIGSAPLNPFGVAVFITSSLSPGAHAITASYLGDPYHAVSLSNAVAVGVFAPLAFGGPAVTSVKVAGPDSLTIAFNRGLLIGPAQDTTNYTIFGPDHKSVTVESAVYDPTNDSVTLTTLKDLAPGQTYQLTINGETGDRLVDVFGIPLNGKKSGKPGHDYVGKVKVKKAAHPAGPKTKAHATAAKKNH